MFRETLSVLATNVRRMSETLTRNQHSFSFISRSRTFRSIRCYRVQQQGRCNFVNPISFSPTLLPARNLLPYLNNLLIKGIQLSITREKEVMEIIRNNNLLERRFWTDGEKLFVFHSRDCSYSLESEAHLISCILAHDAHAWLYNFLPMVW